MIIEFSSQGLIKNIPKEKPAQQAIPAEEQGALELFAAIHRCKDFTAENAHAIFAGVKRKQ